MVLHRITCLREWKRLATIAVRAPSGCYTLDCRRALATRRSQDLLELVSELSWCVCVRTVRAVGSETGIATTSARHPNANSLVSPSRLCMLGCILANLISSLSRWTPLLDSTQNPPCLHPVSPASLGPWIAQALPADAASACCLEKSLPTDIALIVCGPSQVGQWSGPFPIQNLHRIDRSSSVSRSPFLVPFSS